MYSTRRQDRRVTFFCAGSVLVDSLPLKMATPASRRANFLPRTDDEIAAHVTGTPVNFRPIQFRIPVVTQHVFLGADNDGSPALQPTNLFSSPCSVMECDALMMETPHEFDDDSNVWLPARVCTFRRPPSTPPTSPVSRSSTVYEGNLDFEWDDPKHDDVEMMTQ